MARLDLNDRYFPRLVADAGHELGAARSEDAANRCGDASSLSSMDGCVARELARISPEGLHTTGLWPGRCAVKGPLPLAASFIVRDDKSQM